MITQTGTSCSNVEKRLWPRSARGKRRVKPCPQARDDASPNEHTAQSAQSQRQLPATVPRNAQNIRSASNACASKACEGSRRHFSRGLATRLSPFRLLRATGCRCRADLAARRVLQMHVHTCVKPSTTRRSRCRGRQRDVPTSPCNGIQPPAPSGKRPDTPKPVPAPMSAIGASRRAVPPPTDRNSCAGKTGRASAKAVKSLSNRNVLSPNSSLHGTLENDQWWLVMLT